MSKLQLKVSRTTVLLLQHGWKILSAQPWKIYSLPPLGHHLMECHSLHLHQPHLQRQQPGQGGGWGNNLNATHLHFKPLALSLYWHYLLVLLLMIRRLKGTLCIIHLLRLQPLWSGKHPNQVSLALLWALSQCIHGQDLILIFVLVFCFVLFHCRLIA